jgi:nucleotide-binding universal stress UspA family protein
LRPKEKTRRTPSDGKIIMEKKLLLAIDGSKNSLMTLDYISHLFQYSPEVKIVLFHVLPSVPPVYKEGALKDSMAQKYLEGWKKKHQEAIEKILQGSRKRLVKAGWAEAQIQIRAQEKRIGLARDILFEAEKGLYDAIVIGRRGLSRVEEVFLGSVSNKVIQGAGTIPVWVIGGKVTTHKILVALDGSENAMRAVDHLSFILSSCRHREIEVLLLNIWPGFITISGPRIIPHLSASPTSRKDYEDSTILLLKKAEAMILEADLSPDQVKRKINLNSADIGKAIFSEAQKGEYQTVVLGRRGISKAKEFFMGSISNKILQKAMDKAVWIVG